MASTRVSTPIARWTAALRAAICVSSAEGNAGSVASCSRGRMPGDLEEALGLGETLQRVETPIHVFHDTAAVRSPELDPTGDVAGGLRDEDLAGPGSGTDARGQVHGAADVVAVLLTDRLAGVDPDADRDPGARLVTVLLGHGLLDPDRAQDGAAGGLEGDHEAVALGLDDVAAVRFDVAADDEVLFAHELVGSLVAQLLGGVRESPDITEENGDGVGHRHFRRSPGTTTFAVRVFVHSGGASGGTKNSSRCVEKTRRLSKLTFDRHYLRTTRRALRSKRGRLRTGTAATSNRIPRLARSASRTRGTPEASSSSTRTRTSSSSPSLKTSIWNSSIVAKRLTTPSMAAGKMLTPRTMSMSSRRPRMPPGRRRKVRPHGQLSSVSRTRSPVR